MKKILLVEDSKEQALTISRFLKNNNYIVLNAYDGKEALLMLDSELPDIVILDYILPDCNGLEIAKYIKTNYQTFNLPILIISANSGMEITKCDFLKKPFKLADLLNWIKNQYSVL